MMMVGRLGQRGRGVSEPWVETFRRQEPAGAQDRAGQRNGV